MIFGGFFPTLAPLYTGPVLLLHTTGIHITAGIRYWYDVLSTNIVLIAADISNYDRTIII